MSARTPRGPRERWRRRLLLAGLLPLLTALALAVEVGVVLHHDRQGRTAISDGDPGRAVTAFASNRTLNLIEPWVAPHDEGVARLLDDDPSGAVGALTDALALVPAAHECRVRTDLALAHAAAGDRAAAAAARPDLDEAGRERRRAAARASWSAGADAVAPCLDPEDTAPPRTADQAARAGEVDEALRERLAADQRARDDAEGEDGEEQQDPGSAGSSGDQGGQGEQGAGGEAAAQREQLAQRNEDGQQRRQRREDRLDGTSPGAGRGPSTGQPQDGQGPPAYSW